MADSPVIWAQGLTKRYGDSVALAGIDLTVPAGTVFGVLGPNGAGKPVTGLRHLFASRGIVNRARPGRGTGNGATSPERLERCPPLRTVTAPQPAAQRI